MDPCEEVKVLERYLCCFDAEFVVEFALSGPLDALDGGLQMGPRLAGDAQGM